jgi:hypothetical protein
MVFFSSSMLYVASNGPTARVLRAAAVSEESWHQSLAGNDRRQIAEEEVQVISDRHFRIDIIEARTDEGKLHLLVAIARASMFAYAELYTDVSKVIAAQLLHHLIAAGPYKIHAVLTPVVWAPSWSFQRLA